MLLGRNSEAYCAADWRITLPLIRPATEPRPYAEANLQAGGNNVFSFSTVSTM
jgi:hypothetical protein